MTSNGSAWFGSDEEMRRPSRRNAMMNEEEAKHKKRAEIEREKTPEKKRL
jgi:hypothetical protein